MGNRLKSLVFSSPKSNPLVPGSNPGGPTNYSCGLNSQALFRPYSRTLMQLAILSLCGRRREDVYPKAAALN